jgi:hypothetical protein
MNEMQLERWNQVSLGLARSYADLTPVRKAKLLAAVEDCIDWVVCNGLETVEDWDSSVRYGNGWHEYYESAGARVDTYLWDNRYEFEREYKNGNVELVRGRFGDMLAACVRAGFDLAVAPSAGVIGFTVGDLRDIFDGEIPDWVAGYFEDPAAMLSAGRDEGVWL